MKILKFIDAIEKFSKYVSFFSEWIASSKPIFTRVFKDDLVNDSFRSVASTELSKLDDNEAIN